MATIQTRFTSTGEPRYRVRYRHDGAQKVQTFATEDAARRWLALLEALGPDGAVAALSGPAQTRVPTVRELVDEHVAYLTGITEGTRRDYQRMAQRHIYPHLWAVPVTLVDRQAGARFVNALSAAGLAGKTVRNVHALLSAAMTGAARDGLVGENVVKGLRLPATVRAAEMVFLTWEEYQQLLSLTPERWRPLVGVLAESGMRWGEVTALTVADVDHDRGMSRPGMSGDSVVCLTLPGRGGFGERSGSARRRPG